MIVSAVARCALAAETIYAILAPPASDANTNDSFNPPEQLGDAASTRHAPMRTKHAFPNPNARDTHLTALKFASNVAVPAAESPMIASLGEKLVAEEEDKNAELGDRVRCFELNSAGFGRGRATEKRRRPQGKITV